jgi:hypothetical protein
MPRASSADTVSTGGSQFGLACRKSRSAARIPPRHASRGRCCRRRLVDRERVGDLDDALLDALKLVARARQHEHEEEVDHRRHGHLGLADADGLDDDHVVARGLADEHRFARAARDAAERPPDGLGRMGARSATDSCAMRVLSPRMLPPERALDGSTASTATRFPSPRR